jgi:transcriptional regulator GlxA family with amidase domain
VKRRTLFRFYLFLTFGAAALAAETRERRNVAILVWPGVELLDFTGPAEVFWAADHARRFKVYTVGLDEKPVRTQGAVIVQPEFTLENAPVPAVIVIPGGNMRAVENNAAVRAWLREKSHRTEVILSVCTGAFVLAEAGLLDGLKATTHHFGYDELARRFPKITVVRTERFVDNGKLITAGGVSAGIDGALHVVTKLVGKEAAEWTAREWMEYRGWPLTGR